MESIKMKFKVDRSENNEIVNFLIPDLENISVNITDDNSQDIENLFNLIFQEIIQRQKLIEFELDDSNNDLFNEVANDIVIQINSEIKNAESDFKRIIELDNA
jgi:conserved domain protein